jgi:serine/threonine-protein kinase
MATPAGAQGEPDREVRATALALFDEGRRLMTDGQYDQACPKLAESLRLVPGAGTRFNLAECYERSGKLASAWLLYREVTAEMARERDKDREQASRARMQALEPRVSKLQIDVKARIDGLTVARNGRPVGEPLWGTPVPVDPDSYAVDVSAPGHTRRRYKVQVAAEGQTYHVTVEPLVRSQSPDADVPAGATEVGDDDGSVATTAGWVTLGVGLGTVVVGSVLLGVGYSKIGDAEKACPDSSNCPVQDVVDLGNEGRSLALGGIIATALGGATALAGIIVLAVSAGGEDEPPAGELDAAGHRWRGSPPPPRFAAQLGPASARLRLDW